MKMKFKNVLVCTLSILPMFCVSACGKDAKAEITEPSIDYNDSQMSLEWKTKKNSTAYKNTMKLNDKQKKFLINVLANKSVEDLIEGIEDCANTYASAELNKKCIEGANGWGWSIKSVKNQYISDSKFNFDSSKEAQGKVAEIIFVANPELFGEDVTYVSECFLVKSKSTGRPVTECRDSQKSSCLNKKLCADGLYDIVPDELYLGDYRGERTFTIDKSLKFE